MGMNFDLYTSGVVEQTRNETESAGYEQLTTAEDVDKVPEQDGTTLVMINSVCGCAGGIARPAAPHALHYDALPDRLVAVFAGQDKGAAQRAREYSEGYTPLGPSLALVKDRKIAEMIERHQIEDHDVMNITNRLQTLFNEYCEGKQKALAHAKVKFLQDWI